MQLGQNELEIVLARRDVTITISIVSADVGTPHEPGVDSLCFRRRDEMVRKRCSGIESEVLSVQIGDEARRADGWRVCASSKNRVGIEPRTLWHST